MAIYSPVRGTPTLARLEFGDVVNYMRLSQANTCTEGPGSNVCS